MQVVQIDCASASYPLIIDRGLVHRVAQHVVESGWLPTSVVVVMDQSVAQHHGLAVQQSFQKAGIPVTSTTVEATEMHKSISTVERICQDLQHAGLDRHSAVVAVGGGIVGDAAGFAAASYMRGIACIQVPTTLLAMVDASIGGKTGVNLLNTDGTLAKNMVGAFWQPRMVMCDPETLATLDDRELRCGFAECVKHAIIGDATLLPWMQEHAPALMARDGALLGKLVARSSSVKAKIVAQDEREDGVRALLNLGHTFAHAIEALDHANIKHGEAVSIGLVAALALARDMTLGAGASGSTGTAGDAPAWHTTVVDVLQALGLPTRLPSPLPVAKLMGAMQRDKKAVGGTLRFILPFALADVRSVNAVERGPVERAWQAVGAR
jgi:3-dehydroquinate synthase